MASSFVRVISVSLQLLGRRLFLCFTNRWAARIFPSRPVPRPLACDPTEAEWFCSIYAFSFSVSVFAGYSHRDSLLAALKK